MDTLMTELCEAWLRALQVRTPAEAAQNLYVDWLLTWHQAVMGEPR